MINGRFTVLGTPSYLKAQYGQGYSVLITQNVLRYRDPNTNIVTLMQNEIPYSELTYSDAQKYEGQNLDMLGLS